MQSGDAAEDEELLLAVLMATCITTIATLGIAFYARFLFALCKECRQRRICYVVRLPTHTPERTAPDDLVFDTPIPRLPEARRPPLLNRHEY